jgi:hypothetical protein
MESGNWNGLNLPYALDSLGAPGCSLSTNPLLILAAQADAAGQATYELRLPAEPALQNAWIRYQGLAVDAPANALGITFSAGHKVQICGWEPIVRVWRTNLADPTGALEIGAGLVLQLTR